MNRWPRMMAAAWLGLGLGLAGCGKNDDEPDYKTLENCEVIKIDLKTGVVTIRFFSKKQADHVERPGKLAPDAEILIDGKTARLSDVRVGDRAMVVGIIVKKDGNKELVATKVEVTRPEKLKVAEPPGTTRPGE